MADSEHDPVQRYLQQATGGARGIIASARLKQEGELRLDPSSSRWWPFTAVERIRPTEIAFDWDARVRIARVLPIRVQDELRNGLGSGRVSVFGGITVDHEHGTAALNSGALLRFLAEAPWYPTALLASDRLHWSRPDATHDASSATGSATASLASHGSTATLEFRFDPSGNVASIYTAARPRRLAQGRAGHYEMCAWEGHFRNYAERQGLLIPLEGEVGWHVDGSWACVWRGRILEASYEFATAPLDTGSPTML